MGISHTVKCLLCGALMVGVVHECADGVREFYVQSPPARVWLKDDTKDHTHEEQRGRAGVRMTSYTTSLATTTSSSAFG
jgi:hypothetical protein